MFVEVSSATEIATQIDTHAAGVAQPDLWRMLFESPENGGEIALWFGDKGLAPASSGDTLHKVDGAVFLFSGWAGVYRRAADGTMAMVGVALPGDLIVCSADDGEDDLSFKPLTPLRKIKIGRTDLEQLAADDATLTDNILQRRAWQDVAWAVSRPGAKSLPVRRRIAIALLDIWLRLSRTGQVNQDSFSIPLSYRAVGTLVHAGYDDVVRAVRSLTGLGILNWHRRRLEICDLHGLAHHAVPSARSLRDALYTIAESSTLSSFAIKRPAATH